MKAIILAAGRGSRMASKTANMPKCMLELGGRTIIDRCVESIESGGFHRKDIGIVTGYKAESIKIDGVTYFHNPDWETTNMFISLTKVREWLLNDTCIVSYSDIVFSPDAVKALINTDSPLAITYYTKYWDLWTKRFENPFDDLETFSLDGKYLKSIGEKPKNRDEVQGQYMGLLRFEPSAWRTVEEAVKHPMPKPVERLDMTTLLGHLIRRNVKIEAVATDDLWLECDNQTDIELYEKEYGSMLS